MAIEPTESAIQAVADVTSLTRDAAIRWLKANDKDPGKAINAYFENPNVLANESQVNKNTWDEEPFHSDRTDYAFQAAHQTNFMVHPEDSLGPSIFSSAPSRPPTRNSNRGLIDLTAEHAAADPNKSLSVAEREDQELQRAVAMSLDQTLPDQTNGVTGTSNPYFGPASQEHYETNKWAMTLAGQTAHEIILNPEPEDRKRQDNTPAFLKPSAIGYYLPSLVTILHAIPLARETLLLREHVLHDYGYDAEWWDGVAIKVPRIVNLADGSQVRDGEEVINEAQRLMAFLDMTDRAYGSADVLANMKSVLEQGQEMATACFLRAWQQAATKAAPANQATTVFQSSGLKVTPGDPGPPHRVPFHNLDVAVDLELADTGATLYDAIDEVLWPAPYDEDDTEETYLDTIGEIFTLRVIRQGTLGTGLGIKIPAVWYPDRYMRSCKDIVKEMRARKANILKDIDKIGMVQASIEDYKAVDIEPAINARKLLETAITHLETDGDASPYGVNGASDDSRDVMMDSTHRKPGQKDIAKQLRIIAERVGKKLESLNKRREEARNQLRNLSRLLTKPADNPEEPPHNKYTLRGVSTEPHITYVLRPLDADDIDHTPDAETRGWQWWRISYSTADAKVISTTASPSPEPEQGYELDGWGVPKIPASEWARRARRERERNADRAGFSVQKVREVEVLKAARDESTRALLVYASERAVNQDLVDLPPQLKNFVRADNLAFAAELGTPSSPRLTPPSKRKADDNDDDDDENENSLNTFDDDQDIPWGGLPSASTEAAPSASTDPTLPRYVPPPPPRHPARARSGSGSGSGSDEKGRGYDERIPTSLRGRGSGSPPLLVGEKHTLNGGEVGGEHAAGGRGGGGGQEVEVEVEMEMEERGGGPPLGLARGFGHGGCESDADMLGGEERIRVGDVDADAE